VSGSVLRCPGGRHKQLVEPRAKSPTGYLAQMAVRAVPG
jgi:hypothetical protein